MIRQLIPVIITFDQGARSNALTQVIVDFILLAQYKTHNDETLQYLEHALYRIDRTKVVFKQFHLVDKVTAEGHFNFPKFHAMTHIHLISKSMELLTTLTPSIVRLHTNIM